MRLLLSFFIFISFAYSSNNTRTRCSLKHTHALLLFKLNLFSTNHTYDEYDDYDRYCHDWLGSDYHPIMMNWNTSIDCCNWDGVTCDRFTGDVIELDLSCGMLRGTIHPNSTLFNLSRLQRLNLAFNNFTNSRLPREIGRFSNALTHLNISECGFIGQVPTDITLLPKLVSLDLSRNYYGLKLEPHHFYNLLHNSTSLEELMLDDVNIFSILPAYLNISSSLKSLHLSNTDLLGKFPLNVFNLPYLEELDLAENIRITGRFPKVNTSNNIPLKWLDLSNTNLSGELPDSIGRLKSLNHLYLSSTNISGEIPESIGRLKSLNYLSLSYTNISGEIPESIGRLKSLNYLSLSGTNISGEIPESIGRLKSLNYLSLAECGLMGLFPKFLVNLRHLITLDLSNNKLNGTLPSWLFTLPLLERISLNDNMFSGSFPSEAFNHQSLKILSLSTLDLSYNNFSGVWELDTLLSSLTNITTLDLSYNGLSVVTNNDAYYVNPNLLELNLASCKLKVFPKSLRAMKKLFQLDLSNNEIHDHIPDWMGEIGGNNFNYLNLSHNFITGLPQFQWDTLNYLDLQSNQIQGSFPPSICNMTRLMYLDMSNNNISGVIPQCFGNISSFLMMVDLGNNRLRGTIPNAYNNCGRLEGLILNGNHLEGEVPSGLSKCGSLKVLDLGNNRLNGTFPHWTGHLPHLQVLVLKSNKLHGSIENSFVIKHPFPRLKVLDLSQNEFVGHLCGEYFQNFDSMKNVVKKSTKPEYLSIGKFYSITVAVKGLPLLFTKVLIDYIIVDLSSNGFEGNIPKIIGSLNSLKVLNLSHNHLNGRIPNDLENLSEIESLDLSWNRLTGEIPQSLADITTLEVLNLSENLLYGRIPHGSQFSTFDKNSFGGNTGLCGLPLPKPCEHVSSPHLDDDGDEDEENGFTWKVVMMGYGCGTILGLVMGYVMLSTGRPKWFNAIADDGEHMIQMWRNKRRYVYIGK